MMDMGPLPPQSQSKKAVISNNAVFHQEEIKNIADQNLKKQSL
jgi:hypothetical protein